MNPIRKFVQPAARVYASRMLKPTAFEQEVEEIMRGDDEFQAKLIAHAEGFKVSQEFGPETYELYGKGGKFLGYVSEGAMYENLHLMDQAKQKRFRSIVSMQDGYSFNGRDLVLMVLGAALLFLLILSPRFF